MTAWDRSGDALPVVPDCSGIYAAGLKVNEVVFVSLSPTVIC